MKKRKRLARALMFFFVFSVIAMFGAQKGYAAEKYLKSEGTHIDITLYEDGSAVVEETWSYYYGGDTIRRMGRIYLAGEYELTDFEVFLDGERLTILDAPDESYPVGFAAVYKQEDGSTKVDTYLNALEESHQVTISYVVLDAVIVYNDASDFTWNLTSDAEPASISELTANLHIPYGTMEGGLRFWAHGPNGGSFDSIVDEDGIVSDFVLSVAEVPSDMAVAVRLTMPTELFSQASHIVSEDKLDEIIEYESRYEKGRGSKPLENRLLLYSVIPAALGILLLVVGTYVRKPVTKKRLKKLRRKVEDVPAFVVTAPDKLSPVLVKKLILTYPYVNEFEDSKANGQFTLTLLDLVERGFVKADTSQNEVVLSINQSEQETLSGFERDVMDILTACLQGRESVTLSQIGDWFKANREWITEKKAAFQAHIEEAWKALGFEEEQEVKTVPTGKLILGCMLAGLVFVGVLVLLYRNRLAFSKNGVFFLEMGILYPVTMFLFGLGADSILSMLIDTLSFLTEKGERQYISWQAFARSLDRSSFMEQSELLELPLWRRELVYAAALGRNKKLLEQLRIKAPASYQELVFFDDWYYQMLESQAFYGMDKLGGFSLPTGDNDGGSGGDFSSDAGGYDSGSGGGDFE